MIIAWAATSLALQSSISVRLVSKSLYRGIAYNQSDMTRH